jgi:hypothetical protein
VTRVQQRLTAEEEVSVVPQVAPVFALYAAHANANVLNYTNAQKIKLYNKAIEGLTIKFKAQNENLYIFLESVKVRVQSNNWGKLIVVPDTEGIVQNLIERYGVVTIQEYRDHAAAYVAAETHQAQNSVMLPVPEQFAHGRSKAQFLTASEDYQVNGSTTGSCFFKTIITKSHVDTMGTVNTIRESLSNLDTKMGFFKGDITKFNNYMIQQRAALHA